MVLKGKTVLITGANRGIGRAIAEELAKYPVNLLVGMRDTSDFKPIELAKALSIKPIKLDLSSHESIQKDLKNAKNDLENLDILINNAGQFVGGPLANQEIKLIYSMFQVNIVGLIDLTQNLLPNIKKRHGKIVNNASIAGYAYFPFNATYSATKAALVAFSQSLRRELRGSGVTLLEIVTPGVKTEMMNTVEATYHPSGQPISFRKLPPEKWAKKIVSAIKRDQDVLNPPGFTGFLKANSRVGWIIDLVSKRLF